MHDNLFISYITSTTLMCYLSELRFMFLYLVVALKIAVHLECVCVGSSSSYMSYGRARSNGGSVLIVYAISAKHKIKPHLRCIFI